MTIAPTTPASTLITDALRPAAAQDDTAFDAALQTRTQVRESSRQFIATALLQPVLQQMRSDPFKSELFDGGFAEDTFNQLLDTRLADSLVNRLDASADLTTNRPTGFPAVDQMYRKVMQRVEPQLNLQG